MEVAIICLDLSSGIFGVDLPVADKPTGAFARPDLNRHPVDCSLLRGFSHIQAMVVGGPARIEPTHIKDQSTPDILHGVFITQAL